jgi:hypothetical protein
MDSYGWTETRRLPPGKQKGEAAETRDLQPFFDDWKSRPTAGCPDWLWELGMSWRTRDWNAAGKFFLFRSGQAKALPFPKASR